MMEEHLDWYPSNDSEQVDDNHLTDQVGLHLGGNAHVRPAVACSKLLRLTPMVMFRLTLDA